MESIQYPLLVKRTTEDRRQTDTDSAPMQFHTVLGMEPRASHMLSKCFAMELQPSL